VVIYDQVLTPVRRIPVDVSVGVAFIRCSFSFCGDVTGETDE
jgi:hypothetical protein